MLKRDAGMPRLQARIGVGGDNVRMLFIRCGNLSKSNAAAFELPVIWEVWAYRSYRRMLQSLMFD